MNNIYSSPLARRSAIAFAILIGCAVEILGQGTADKTPAGYVRGQPRQGQPGVARTVRQIMSDPAARQLRKQTYLKREFELPNRRHRPQDPNAQPASTYPRVTKPAPANVRPLWPQVVSTNFNAVTGPTETGAFPPDSMGAVGPTQFVVFVNGRLRTFNKTTGAADGVLDVNPDSFFSSVMTPGLNFTTDPQVRFDRLTKRWFLGIIDVPSSSDTSIGDMPNRFLLAVSDAASNGVISSSTVWTFFFVQQDSFDGADTGEFLDYDTLAVDANAIYVGGNMFDAESAFFVGTSVFVIQKSSVLGSGPIVVTPFRDLLAPGDGPQSPRGVDNFDPAATEGYIVGVSIEAFGRLILLRVSDPGGEPSISGNIPVTVNSTSFPISVDHAGNSNGNNGRLDAIDDRLYSAHIRNGRLWTAHTIAVSAAGIATDGDVQARDGVRWYELSVPAGSGSPTVAQSGTVFDSFSEVASAHQFWMPSVMVSGQGHVAFGYSAAGLGFRVNAAANGRLIDDVAGTSGIPTLFTNSTTAYNPAGDPGGSFGRRWGDYSFTSLDPEDDMTMWTVQEYCNGTNTYGVRVAKLLAPPPAVPAVASASVPLGQAATNVTITGISVSGSGFFDPGSGFNRRIGAAVTGGVVVNSVTYVDPTHVVLNVNTVAASEAAQDVTITNPDGQARTGNGILAIGSALASPPPSPTPTPAPSPLPTPTPAPPYGEITEPVPGSTLTGPIVTFRWSQGSATAFWLTVGTTPGGTQLFSSGQTGGLFAKVSNIPTDGRPIYVRLWSFVGGVWYVPPQEYVFNAQAANVSPPVIAPASGRYRKKVRVSMACATPGATIRYTLDGTVPHGASLLYSGPFTITKKGVTTVRAKAFKPPVPDSPPTAASYTIR